MRIASYFTPDTTRRCESIIPLARSQRTACSQRAIIVSYGLNTNHYVHRQKSDLAHVIRQVIAHRRPKRSSFSGNKLANVLLCELSVRDILSRRDYF